MDEYIFDGEIHSLTNQLGYISKKIQPWKDGIGLEEEYENLYRKYVEYLIDNKRDELVKYLIMVFKYNLFEEYFKGSTLIVRPPHLCSSLSQYGTISLKFERIPGDNLGNS